MTTTRDISPSSRLGLARTALGWATKDIAELASHQPTARQAEALANARSAIETAGAWLAEAGKADERPETQACAFCSEGFEDRCLAAWDGWICTRPKWHAGSHVACAGGLGHELESWDGEPAEDPLLARALDGDR